MVDIGRVFFGCGNDKFGGNGTILPVHTMRPNPYESTGGIMAEEGIRVLQKFYERGNESIPLEKRNRFKKTKKEVERAQV